MKKHFLIALVAMISLVACKKEKGDVPGTNPGSSKTLKRMIETTAGQITTYNLSYDASKRLTSINSTDNSETTSFTYAADGNVTKIENKDGNERNVFDITYANGLPVSGTYKTYEKNGTEETLTEQYTMTYTVENAQVTKIKMVLPADPNDLEINYNLSYASGNLARVESTGFFPFTASFTYGTKKPIVPAIFKYVLDPVGFSLEFFSKNELLSSHYDYPDNSMDLTVTNVYTYDSDGYVLTANNGETQTKFEYE